MCEMQTADQTIMSNISCEFIELYLLYRYIVGNRRIMVGQFSTDYSQRFDFEHLVFFLHHHHDELLVVDFIVAVNISLRHLKEKEIRPNFKVVKMLTMSLISSGDMFSPNAFITWVSSSLVMYPFPSESNVLL